MAAMAVSILCVFICFVFSCYILLVFVFKTFLSANVHLDVLAIKLCNEWRNK